MMARSSQRRRADFILPKDLFCRASGKTPLFRKLLFVSEGSESISTPLLLDRRWFQRTKRKETKDDFLAAPIEVFLKPKECVVMLLMLAKQEKNDEDGNNI